MWGRVGIIVATITAAFALTGAGQVSPATDGPENAAAAHAVAVLTGHDDGAVADAVPSDFEQVMGYEPVAVTDAGGAVRVLDPSGECSSPVGTTGYDFARACRVHDFGYDLLRYAVVRGGELGPWARMALDDQFGAMLRARCDNAGGASCRAAAELTLGAVKVNSWRQGYGQPGDEDPVPYIVAGLLLVSACVGPPLVRRLRSLG